MILSYLAHKTKDNPGLLCFWFMIPYFITAFGLVFRNVIMLWVGGAALVIWLLPVTYLLSTILIEFIEYEIEEYREFKKEKLESRVEWAAHTNDDPEHVIDIKGGGD